MRALAVVILSAACGARPAAAPPAPPAAPAISAAEAHTFVSHLADTATLDPRDFELALPVTCADTPSCGGACTDALREYASLPPVDRDVQFLRHCDEAARAIVPASGGAATPDDVTAKIAAFVRARVEALARRVRPSLGPDDQAALDRARAALGLSSAPTPGG